VEGVKGPWHRGNRSTTGVALCSICVVARTTERQRLCNNLLRGSTRNVEAEAALRAATRVDPTFADAWYNLGDLLDEQGRSEAGIECLRTALRVAPDYADAMFNLALMLQRKNQYAEAADYWRRCLTTDRQSDWAVRARRSLKFCEMQVQLVASHS
jgi:tetratricopeptide (TPR) repeat protein